MKAYKIIAKHGSQRVFIQDLRGTTVTDYNTAWRLAEELARKQTAITNQPWTAVVEEYTVGNRPGSELI